MIPKELFDKYKYVADNFIYDLGIDFNLHFVSQVPCDCQNSYAGPNPMCGYCETGKEREVVVVKKFRFYPNHKYWIKTTIAPSVDASAQIIGFLNDIPDLKNCNFLVKQSGQLVQKFKLAGEPQSHGFVHDRYFIAYLQQIA